MNNQTIKKVFCYQGSITEDKWVTSENRIWKSPGEVPVPSETIYRVMITKSSFIITKQNGEELYQAYYSGIRVVGSTLIIGLDEYNLDNLFQHVYR